MKSKIQNLKSKIFILNILCLLTVIGLPGIAIAQNIHEPLRVAAASDLTKPFTEVVRLYEQKTGRKVLLSFGASGQLAKQIENGAPFDLFASANERYISDLEKKGEVVEGTRRIYAQGHIGFWTRSGGPDVPKDFKMLDTGRYAKIAIANPDFAPYGMAAKEAMQAAKVWNSLKSRLVYGENIQQAFQFASTGNADAAILSQSTAFGSAGHFVLISDSLYKPIMQALAVLKISKQQKEAIQFSDFLAGKPGQAILKKYGLALPVPISVVKRTKKR